MSQVVDKKVETFLIRVEAKLKMGAKDKQGFDTVPYDPRFPNTNQTKHCYQNYLDFHRCSKKRGEHYEACNYFRKAYQSLCPYAWVEKWDNEVAQGTFPGKI